MTTQRRRAGVYQINLFQRQLISCVVISCVVINLQSELVRLLRYVNKWESIYRVQSTFDVGAVNSYECDSLTKRFEI